jgi:hypothetical protein
VSYSPENLRKSRCRKAGRWTGGDFRIALAQNQLRAAAEMMDEDESFIDLAHNYINTTAAHFNDGNVRMPNIARQKTF